ncbi:MAG: hypothetical protein C4519_04700 [Desulfobacteraceae bacterium]|nr:MAG: hypothetical protein C4519_04700 [Desulfobacteraceae bacterium]
MRLSKKIAAHFIVPALLICSAVGLVFGANTVICTCETGHAAIKLGANGECLDCCGETGGACGHEGSSSSGTCVHLCADIPCFKHQPDLKASFGGNPDPGEFSILPDSQGESPAFSIHFTFFTQQADFLSPALAHRRTVLLLI